MSKRRSILDRIKAVRGLNAKPPRRMPNLTERLCWYTIQRHGIDHDTAKTMTTEKILELDSWDHFPTAWNTARDLGWSSNQTNHPSNIRPLSWAQNKEKNNKVDTPQAAKGRRLTADQEEHRRRMLAKTDPDVEPEPDEKRKYNWPSQKFPPRPMGRKRKNQP